MRLPQMRASTKAGLGDESEDAPGWTAAHVETLREIRNSIAALTPRGEGGGTQ